ncbi:MAG: NCS2 family permease [Acholeplasmataceae bacterium]|nr:NCS2 family permease [Acholeplasmataceae bacterium]
MQRIKDFFGIEQRSSSIRIELLGGLTTFLTMAYILFVNPLLMAGIVTGDDGLPLQLVAGLDMQAVFLATALSAGVATLAMGLFAKLPIALAPGMGLNAFFSFTIVVTMGRTWEEALAAVLLSGVLYLIISVSGLRAKVVAAIPESLKYAIGAGIGFFIAYIGLANVGIVVQGEGTLSELGDLSNPVALLALFGLVLTLALLAFKVRAAVFFGLVGTAIAGLIVGLLGVDGMPVYDGIVGSVPSLAPTFGKAFGAIPALLSTAGGWFAVFAFLFVDFFDTSGTLMAVTGQMGGVTEEELKKANVVDASGTVFGSILGTSTTTSYIESLSGVGVGARTGLAAVVTGALFLLSIFFAPLLSLVTAGVTAAAMIVVGTMMASAIGKIDWSDWPIAVSSFITILVMVLTYSISDGIGFGFLTYIIVSVAGKRGRDVSPLLYGVGALFVLYLTLMTIFG